MLRKSHHITKLPVKYEKCFILRMVGAFHISIVKGEEWGMLAFFFFYPSSEGTAPRRGFFRTLTDAFLKSPFNQFAKLVLGQTLLVFC